MNGDRECLWTWKRLHEKTVELWPEPMDPKFEIYFLLLCMNQDEEEIFSLLFGTTTEEPDEDTSYLN